MGNTLRSVKLAVRSKTVANIHKSENDVATPLFFTLPFEETIENVGRAYCLLYKASGKIQSEKLRPSPRLSRIVANSRLLAIVRKELDNTNSGRGKIH